MRLIGLSQTTEATAESVRQIIGPCHLYMAICPAWIHCSIIYLAAPSSCLPLPASTSDPLLPTVVFLVVVVLPLITCVALLVLALAVTATKLNRLRAEKGHTDQSHYHSQTGGGEGKTTERIYDKAGREQATLEDRRGTTRS